MNNPFSHFTKKTVIGIVAGAAAIACVGTGVGVHTYQVHQKAVAEERAEEQEYKGYAKQYKAAEEEIKKTAFFNDQNAFDEAITKTKQDELTKKLSAYKKAIDNRSMTSADKKAYKELLKTIKKQHEDSAEGLGEVASAVLESDTSSLGAYYTDDMKNADAASKEAYEKAEKNGDMVTAYKSLNSINANKTAAYNAKTEADQKAAAEAAAAAEAQKAQQAADAQKAQSNTSASNNGSSKSSSSKSSKRNSTSSSNSAQKQNGSASTASNNGSSNSTATNNASSGKDWKHSPIDYNHKYTKSDIPDGWTTNLEGFPMKIATSGKYAGTACLTSAGAQAYVAKHPDWAITTEPNGQRVCYSNINGQGLDADGWASAYMPIID
jgi:hypothetical protein